MLLTLFIFCLPLSQLSMPLHRLPESFISMFNGLHHFAMPQTDTWVRSLDQWTKPLQTILWNGNLIPLRTAFVSSSLSPLFIWVFYINRFNYPKLVWGIDSKLTAEIYYIWRWTWGIQGNRRTGNINQTSMVPTIYTDRTLATPELGLTRQT